MLKLLCDGNVSKMQKLWLRKQGVVANSRQLAGSQPWPKQQSRAARPEPEPAARPKQQTPAQAARRERSQRLLRQKHLASKLWACVRVAVRLQAWRVRTTSIGVLEPRGQADHNPWDIDPALFDAEGRFESVGGPCRQVPQHRLVRKVLPCEFRAEPPAAAAASAVPAIQTKEMSELIAEKALRAQTPPTTSETTTETTRATTTKRQQQGQRRSERLAAAALEAPDDMELQESRGSKRDATARTPPPNSNLDDPDSASQLRLPPTVVKKSRGGAACLSR